MYTAWSTITPKSGPPPVLSIGTPDIQTSSALGNLSLTTTESSTMSRKTKTGKRKARQSSLPRSPYGLRSQTRKQQKRLSVSSNNSSQGTSSSTEETSTTHSQRSSPVQSLLPIEVVTNQNFSSTVNSTNGSQNRSCKHRSEFNPFAYACKFCVIEYCPLGDPSCSFCTNCIEIGDYIFDCETFYMQ